MPQRSNRSAMEPDAGVAHTTASASIGVMVQLWAAIAVAVLTVIVGPVLRGEFGNRSTRRLAHHASLRESLSGNTGALEAIDELIEVEAIKLRKRELRRLSREIDGGSIAALIFVTVVGSGVVYGLIALANAISSGPWYWALIFLATGVGGLAFGISAVGTATIYKYPDNEES